MDISISSIPAALRSRFPIFMPVNWHELPKELPRYLKRDEDLHVLILITSQLFARSERRGAMRNMKAMSRPRLIELVERLRGTVNVRYAKTGVKPIFSCNEIFAFEDPPPFQGTCRAGDLDRANTISDRQYHGSYQE